MLETIPRPLEPDAVLGTFLGWMPHDARVVAVGPDQERFSRLRTALARQHLSVTLAWHAAQALQLVRTSRPDLVLVDLGLPRLEGHLLVAQLATVDPPPSLLLLGGPGDEAQFSAVLRQLVVQRAMRARDEVLASVLCGCESPVHAPRRVATAFAPEPARRGMGQAPRTAAGSGPLR
jgi:CheY-like chemotaxis protein